MKIPGRVFPLLLGNVFLLLTDVHKGKKQMGLSNRQKPVQLTSLHQNGKSHFGIL